MGVTPTNSAAAAKRARRTQSERTAATKAALLAATIDGVLESGYASVTSADIARRAGVTRGAVAHHFASKTDLVLAAMQTLADTVTDQYVGQLPEPGAGIGALADMLDTLWALHTSGPYSAARDIWVGARAEPETRRALQDLEHELTSRFREAACAIFADTAPASVVADLLNTTIATVRGLTITVDIDDERTEWKTVRGHLITLWRAVLGAEVED